MGVLALGNTIDHNYISPAVYPGDKPEKQLSLLHQFHDIESNLNKFDILGHNAPWTLAKLKELTGVDPEDRNIVKVNDERVYRLFWDKTIIYDQLTKEQQELFETQFSRPGLNNGTPELSTTFLGQMLKDLTPVCLNDIIQIEGLSHKF